MKNRQTWWWWSNSRQEDLVNSGGVVNQWRVNSGKEGICQQWQKNNGKMRWAVWGGGVRAVAIAMSQQASGTVTCGKVYYNSEVLTWQRQSEMEVKTVWKPLPTCTPPLPPTQWNWRLNCRENHTPWRSVIGRTVWWMKGRGLHCYPMTEMNEW